MQKIIGRYGPRKYLDELEKAPKSHFLLVYGRRRIGKTYLIRSYFEGRFTFRMTGMANVSMDVQLANFHAALREQSPEGFEPEPAKDWFTAFQQLMVLIERSEQEKKIIFLDELPWMDTPRSQFLSALEHLWNDRLAMRQDILLIVCGSAASWMINKLLNAKGGLHNRITGIIKLDPFKLAECEEYLTNNDIVLSRYQITELYMAFGGVPYYLSLMKKGLSPAQIIDSLCFAPDAMLKSEFANLYSSLFKKSHNHEEVVMTLAKKGIGLTREEIISQTKLPNGGGTTEILNELEESGFIRKYSPIDRIKRESIYQLTDFFSLFHQKFINSLKQPEANYWLSRIDSPSHRAWSGYAFEQVCMAHLPQIKKALGISGVQTEVGSWRSRNSPDGCQIDLLIDRRDGIINLCEMKFSIGEFDMDKKTADSLRNKITVFKSETQTKKAVHTVLITPYGIKNGIHAAETVMHSLTLEQLFDK